MAFHSLLIEFAPGSQLAMLPSLLSSLNQQYLVFLLPQNAVNYADRELMQSTTRWPDNVNYYAIGSTTGQLFHCTSRLPVIYPQEGETSETLLNLPTLQRIQGKKALIMQGSGGRELLAETLTERGVEVAYCECYQRSPIYYDASRQSILWQLAEIDALVVTSGKILQQLYELVPEYYRNSWLLRCSLVVVSKRLVAIARQMG